MNHGSDYGTRDICLHLHYRHDLREVSKDFSSIMHFDSKFLRNSKTRIIFAPHIVNLAIASAVTWAFTNTLV